MRTLLSRRLRALVAPLALLSLPAHAIQAPTEFPCETAAKPTPSAEFMALLTSLGRQRELLFLRETLLPVLEEGARTDLATFRLLENGVSGVEVSSAVGTYRYELTDDASEEDPEVGSPEVLRRGDQSLSAELKVFFEKVKSKPNEVIGKIRSSWRADPFLFPALRVPNDEKRPTVLTYPQRQAVEVLSQWDQGAFMASTGIGKTIVAAHVYKNTFGNPEFCRQKNWNKKGKVIFVLENNEALESAVNTFKREVGFRDIARIFGNTTAQAINGHDEMIAITRSSYYSRMHEIHELIQSDPTQPWFFVFDEAHHLGTEGGQFEEIINDLDRFSDPRYHRRLSLSATLWHNESKDLIRKLFRGNVWGPYLKDEELRRLRNGDDLDELSRIQLQRTTEQGYLAPNEGVRIVRHVGNQAALSLLNQSTRTKQTTHVDIPSELVADLYEQILRMRMPHTTDRTVIYVPSRLHANGYATELQKLMKDGEVRALHRGENLDGSQIDVDDTLDWFKDEGDRYTNLTNRRKHKYMIVVDMMKEAVDIPCINMLIMLEAYSINMEGLRNYLQEYGRGTRVHPFKTGLRLLDYSGFTEVFGGEGLRFISVGGKSDGAASRGSRERRATMLTIDGEPITAREFDRIAAELQHQIGLGPITPHFNSLAFARGACVALANEARSRKFQFELESGASTYLIFLIRSFSDASVKTQVRAQFDRIKGWKKADGQFCKNGDSEACLRIYRGLRLIGEAIKELALDAANPLQLHLLDDPEHGYTETEKILDILRPERNRTTRVFDNLDAEAVAFFAQGLNAGTDKATEVPLEKLLAVLTRNLQYPLDADGARRGFDFFVANLPEFDGYDLLKREIEEIAFARDDVKRAQRGLRDPVLRIYTALRIIATYLSRNGFDVDPLRIHESLSMERLLRIIAQRNGLAVPTLLINEPNQMAPRLDALSASEFFDESKGALPLLVNLAAALKVDFYSESGARELSQALWSALPAGPTKDACGRALEGLDKEWTKGDGRAAAGAEHRLTAINRYFALLYHIGNALRLAGDAVIPETLFKRSEFYKLTRLLFPKISLDEKHRWIKPAEDADVLTKFRESPGGALATFMDAASRFDLRVTGDYSTRDYLFALIAPLKDEDRKRALQSEIEKINWAKADYDSVRSGIVVTGRRFYRLLQKVAVLYGIGSFESLPPMSRDDQAQDLLTRVFETYHRSERVLRMSVSERKRFVDMESGAIRAIVDRAQQLKIPLRQPKGIVIFIERLCEALPESPRKDELVRTILALKWGRHDGAETSGSLVQDRLHETLLRILRYLKGLPGYTGAFRKHQAVNVAQRDVTEKIFAKLFDEGSQANAMPLMRRVRLSAQLPELDDKKFAAFNDPETGARASLREHGQRRFMPHWKPGFSRLSMLEYALLLPKSERKAIVIEKIREMDWNVRDFEGLSKHLRGSTQRYFLSLSWLAWGLNTHENGFRSLFTREDADELLGTFPDFVSLPKSMSEIDVELFTDESKGALKALFDGARAMNIDLEHLAGFTELVESMRVHCPAGIQKVELQKELLEALPVYKRPYHWARKGNAKALVDIYRFLFAAAALYQIGGADVSMDEMLTREGVEKLLRLLRQE